MNRAIVVLAILAVALGAQAQGGVKKRRPLPPEFGRVVINVNSERAGLPGVTFDHWLHRAKFTCRVCHVDIGFAMKGGATGIRAADNAGGAFCGSCHNGRMLSDGRKVFEACAKTTERRPSCFRCHVSGRDPKPEIDFATFTKGLPKGRFGNGIDWEKAEEQGLIRPVDYVEGVSIRRNSISAQKDFALGAKLEGMPDIIFSHKKHTVWNGCELCHPDIFVGVKKGASKYSMVQIFEGQSCGVCHVTVAFPLTDCQRCHSKPVSAASSAGAAP